MHPIETEDATTTDPDLGLFGVAVSKRTGGAMGVCASFVYIEDGMKKVLVNANALSSATEASHLSSCEAFTFSASKSMTLQPEAFLDDNAE
eukprot:3391587-Pyramimonas_sp.AAC.1